MIPREPLLIVGGGAVTSVGATRAVVAAAVRAGVARIQQVPSPEPIDGEEDAIAHVARIETLDDEVGTATRMSLAVERAATEALRPIALAAKPFDVAIWIVAPADAAHNDEAIHQALARAFAAVGPFARAHGLTRVSGGHAEGLAALIDACRSLEQHASPLALVVGVDALCTDANLRALHAAGRLHGSDNAWGFVPGEGAAAVLLGRSNVALPGAPLARVRGYASASEGADPCIGEALTTCVRSALEPLSADERAGQVFCDLNGERARTDEWGFALPRVAQRLRAPSDFITAAGSCGDVGAAAGPLLVCLASSAASATAREGAFALVWAASDAGARAAVLLERSTGSEPARAPAPADEALGDLDRSVLAELLGEAEFQLGRRAKSFEDPQPLPDWTATEPVEDRIEALVDGLAGAGSLGAEVCAAGALPAGAYVATRVGIRQHGVAGARALLTGLPLAQAPVCDACVTAFVHELDDASPWPQELGALTADFAPLVAGVLGRRAVGEAPGLAAQLMVPEAKPSPELARAIGRVGGGGDAAGASAWLRDDDAATRHEAALAQLRLRGRAALREFGERLDDAALRLPLALAADEALAQRLAGVAAAVATPDDAWSLALTGDSAVIPRLLDALAGAAAGAAAEALEVLTGAGLVEVVEITIAKPDEELDDAELEARRSGDAAAGVDRVTVTRLSRDRTRWSGVAAPLATSGLRLRAGAPAHPRGNVALLTRAALPAGLRRLLAEELRIRWGAPTAFDASMLVRQQRAALQQLARWADGQPAADPWTLRR